MSLKKKFVVFLPWKTASQTIALRLKTYNESPYPRFFYFNRYLNRVVHQHITCADFECLPESRLKYFRASFVRNPYDRVYSGFIQLQKDVQYQPKAAFVQPWIRRLVAKQLSENFSQLALAGFEFNAWFDLVSEEQVFEIGRNTNFPLHPAHYWTHYGDNQVVDFIGRVETFETDFQEFLNRVGIEEPVPAVNMNITETVPDNSNKGAPDGYKYVNRMNTASVDKINRLFDRDFKLFGYDKLCL
ncbi:MAG: sulfotransferase family 2 domain-containing protein [Desulfobacteraceae bacterium]|nr:sulfotransferase family 2 domain-containing protein [Desulfobacteraceae bacterium]